MTKSFVGKLLLAIGVLHSFAAFALFRHPLSEMVAEGLFNTTGNNSERGYAAWFFYGGIALILLGLLTTHLERENVRIPQLFGWGLFAWAVLGIVVTPASGFWLLLIPALLSLYAAKNQA